MSLKDERRKELREAWERKEKNQWKIADVVLAITEDEGREVIAELARELICEPRTVDQYRWVAEQIPPEIRREELSFCHHRAVAALPREQVVDLLDRAASERLSVHVLMAIITESVDKQKNPRACMVCGALTQPGDTSVPSVSMGGVKKYFCGYQHMCEWFLRRFPQFFANHP